eukprot:Tbor_TRINITY_DN4027_c0_g1::TRINITY_DN4027_c0_g1_i1::g.11812::m.11812
MSTTLHQFNVKILAYGSTEPVFADGQVMLDPMYDNANAICEKLGVRAFIIHGAQLINKTETIRNWYTPVFPIVVVEYSVSFEESDEWAKNPNVLARLLNARVNIQCALVCCSRVFWQAGYTEFFQKAYFLRTLIAKTGLCDYQRRTEIICLSISRKELMPIAPFMPRDRNLLLSPSLLGDATGGKYVGEWTDVARPKCLISTEEAALMKDRAKRMQHIHPYLKCASKAVVRIFGYHPMTPDSSLGEMERERVVTATGFFISPIHILTTRTIKFYPESNTYAYSFCFSRSVRAVHAMLVPDVDLLKCHEVPKQVETIADMIRSIGVEVADSKVPAGFQSAPWCDLMLLEVTRNCDAVGDSEYLLPEQGVDTLMKGDEVFALHYPSRPSEEFFTDNFGTKGHNTAASGNKITPDVIRVQCWDYNQLLLSVGCLHVDVNPEYCEIQHTCTMLPGSRGAPIIHNTYTTFDNSIYNSERLQQEKQINGSAIQKNQCTTFAGIQVGRAVQQLDEDRDNIISMSISEAAQQDALSFNMYNEAVSSNHIVLILLYLIFIKKAITNTDHLNYLNKFLSPYKVMTSPDIFHNCHKRVMKDADDCNEFGMDFYEHQDLTSALVCFREGARLLTTACIPNMTDRELELKDALNTNLSAVVMAKLGSGVG